MIPYEKKECVKTLFFDSIPIENYVVPFLHVEISVGSKIVYSYFEWNNKWNCTNKWWRNKYN